MLQEERPFVKGIPTLEILKVSPRVVTLAGTDMPTSQPWFLLATRLLQTFARSITLGLPTMASATVLPLVLVPIVQPAVTIVFVPFHISAPRFRYRWDRGGFIF